MQIACKRFSCQKAVEVCYWACKYRRDCKDWHNALSANPGIEAVTDRLKEAAKKSGRTFDSQTMILTSRGKKNRAAIVSKSSSASLKTGGTFAARGDADLDDQSEQLPGSTIPTHHEEVKDKMTEDNFDIPVRETATAVESAIETSSKPVAAKAKIKPVVKPKPAIQNNGPVFLLLYPNGKYKELRESELNSEAADVLKDSSLRLVKGQHLVPQISFKPAEE